LTISGKLQAGPDVLTFVTDVLSAPMKIRRQPIANLVASTTGTDSDWVVKLIDVYPDEVAGSRKWWISADDLRGHFSRALSRQPGDGEANRGWATAAVSVRHATANHVFSTGTSHEWCRFSQVGSRCMTEIRRRLCRIFSGPKPKDFRSAVQRVYHTPGETSFIELPLLNDALRRVRMSPQWEGGV